MRSLDVSVRDLHSTSCIYLMSVQLIDLVAVLSSRLSYLSHAKS